MLRFIFTYGFLLLLHIPAMCQEIFFCDGKPYTARYKTYKFNVLVVFTGNRVRAENIKYAITDIDTTYMSLDSIATFKTERRYDPKTDNVTVSQYFIIKNNKTRTILSKQLINGQYATIDKQYVNEEGRTTKKWSKEVSQAESNETWTYYNNKGLDTLRLWKGKEATFVERSLYSDTGIYKRIVYSKSIVHENDDTSYVLRSAQNKTDTIRLKKSLVIDNVNATLRSTLAEYIDYFPKCLHDNTFYFVYENGTTIKLNEDQFIATPETKCFKMEIVSHN